MSAPVQTEPTTEATTPQGDPAPVVPPAATAAPPATEPPAQQGDPADLGEGGKKAIQAERAARQKAEQDLAALRKQIEDANKTAEQKAADALREAQESATVNAAKALRYEVAAELGVPLAMASRLVGSTRAEIEADAAVLLAQIPQGAGRPTGPQPSPAQGARPQSPQAAEDAEYEQYKAHLFSNHNTERA